MVNFREVPGFEEKLKQLETSTTCHSLTLYSFLMLPMQRITRWPLLVDAVLKRLSQQDPEYLTCQYSLATLNKVLFFNTFMNTCFNFIGLDRQSMQRSSPYQRT